MNNSASYGNNSASYGRRYIGLVINNRRVENISNITAVSGQTLESLSLALLDDYGNIVTTDNFGQATVQSRSNSTILKGQTATKASNGFYIFDDLILIDDPNSHVELEFITTAISYDLLDPITG